MAQGAIAASDASAFEEAPVTRGGKVDSPNNGVAYAALEQRVHGVAYAALEQRVHGLERDVRDLGSNLQAGFAAINQKLEERSRIQWPAFALAFAIVSAVGALAYWPVRESTQDTKEQITTRPTRAEVAARFSYSDDAIKRLDLGVADLTKNSASRYEMMDKFTALDERAKALREASNERLRGIEGRVAELQRMQVPRVEHDQRWAANTRELQDLQRQIDDVKKSFGDTFSLRDALQTMQRRLDTLESERLRIPRSS